MNFEKIIIGNLVKNDTYLKKVFPFLKDEYFSSKTDKYFYNILKEYIDKYNSVPSLKTVGSILSSSKNLSEDEFKECKDFLFEISQLQSDEFLLDWLLTETENFCKEKSLHNAIVESIDIIEKQGAKGLIPELVSNALSVSFNSSIGHDYIDDAEERYLSYTKKEDRVPFKLEMLNRITSGGLLKKTLNIFIAGTGVGKSLMMGNLAADALLMGRNVLYLTMEMASKEGIGKRIDANMLDISINSLNDLGLDNFMTRINRLKMKSVGKLIIEEYPTSAASVLHFKNLLNELKLKKKFIPDVIFVDYLGICASSRLKLSNQVNSYAVQKAVAEELRAMAKEYDVPIVTAVQFNREGMNSSDPTMSNTSDSFGVPFTADLMLALVSNEELESMNQMMIIQLKNRYNDVNRPKKFMIGVDKEKMKFYDLDNSTVTFKLKKDDKEENEETGLSDFVFDKKKAFDDFV